jgi:cellobiose-specific phosphotransferase system component IIB
MSIKTVVDSFKKAIDSDDDDSLGTVYELHRDEMEQASDEAKKLILEKLSEGDFVKLLAAIEKVVVAECVAGGETSLLLCEMKNELQAYTHSVVLTAIGFLVQDEIL